VSYHSESLIGGLHKIARQVRVDVIEMIHRREAGHPGGSLSIVEILVALYFHHLRIKPEDPSWPERDRFILSKGHGCSALYATLARRGFFPPEKLETWGHIGSFLQGHPDRLKTPGVEMSSGFLGHGLAIGVGLALAARIRGFSYQTYVLLGDGECQAGIVWEGAMAAGKYKLSNLTVIVDYNDVQLDGIVHEIMPLEPFIDKWCSFNFEVLQINGHNMREILDSLDMALEIHEKPVVIIARTTKGKGVSYMENKSIWHGRAPTEEELKIAKTELLKEEN